MKDYLDFLIEQFIKAKGIKYIDLHSDLFLQEFCGWIQERKLLGEKYADFIRYMESRPLIESEMSFEVSKGKYDTISNIIEVGIITPYAEEINSISNNIIIGELEVYESYLIVLNKRKIMPIDTTIARRFITHNPYTNNHIQNWDKIHNSGEANITIGIFGNTSDKDINDKVKQIEDIKNNLQDDFKEDYTTIDDSYYYVISSNRKVKSLNLSKHK